MPVKCFCFHEVVLDFLSSCAPCCVRLPYNTHPRHGDLWTCPALLLNDRLLDGRGLILERCFPASPARAASLGCPFPLVSCIQCPWAKEHPWGGTEVGYLSDWFSHHDFPSVSSHPMSFKIKKVTTLLASLVICYLLTFLITVDAGHQSPQHTV